MTDRAGGYTEYQFTAEFYRYADYDRSPFGLKYPGELIFMARLSG